jgi:hypothetical protein
MMRASFLVLTAMGTLATTYAGRAKVYSAGGCTGDVASSVDFTSGSCVGNGNNDGSGLVTCTGTEFTAKIWLTSTNCGYVAVPGSQGSSESSRQ